MVNVLSGFVYQSAGKGSILTETEVMGPSGQDQCFSLEDVIL